MKSEIDYQMMVTGELDAIIVTGAQPGKNIKFYTISGVEVKSVISNENLLNMSLPHNQIYIVKTVQSHSKEALE